MIGGDASSDDKENSTNFHDFTSRSQQDLTDNLLHNHCWREVHATKVLNIYSHTFSTEIIICISFPD